MIEKKLVKEFKRGPYLIRHEKWTHGNEPATLIKSAYTLSGDWIGETKKAYRMWKKYGITQFEKTDKNHCVCSIGYNPKKRKWYGWSHRAFYGFGKGYVAKEGTLPTQSGYNAEYLKTHKDNLPVPVGFKVKNMKDAKRVAIAFAASVS